MSSEPVQMPNGKPSVALAGGRRKLIMLVAVTIAIIIILAVLVLSLPKKEYFNFTSFIETDIVTNHYSNGTDVQIYDWQWSNDADYSIGEPMTFWTTIYNQNPGTLRMIGVENNLTGFAFIGTNPTLPVISPNTTYSSEGLKVFFTFNTPSTNYDGPFRYIVYYDRYLQDNGTVQNNITSVIETQIITVHSPSGDTTQRYIVDHPTLAGRYQMGTTMTFNEFYRYEGPGMQNITSIASNTTGFHFASSVPTLPIEMPNATQPWLTLSMTFTTPSYQYNGSFNYAVFFDRYTDGIVPQYHNLSSVLEVQYVTTHYGPINNTVRYLRWHNDTAGLYPMGEVMNITEPFWNAGTGTLSITSIVSNVTGFTFINTSPPLPVAVPNSPDQDAGNVTIVISFEMPVSQYIGHFEYIVYFENYLV